MGRLPLFFCRPERCEGSSWDGYTVPNELRDASVRESFAELLSELGYEVIACENGEEAVKIYQEQGPFDLAILDYTVPGKWNGIEVLRELKKVDPEVKAILATGYGQTETVVLAKQEGFKEVLVKPFEVKKLLKALKASLS
ncbi:MAG: response regulator [Caldimicrobium sp.]|jgi:DNA-binding NtrC family response regulator|nr:response regulator [Caldimicrobium sp.]